MEQRYCFRTDDMLCIKEWDENMAELTGIHFAAVSGKKYHDVIPRIIDGDRDALLVAMERGEASRLDYTFSCLGGQSRANIAITPQKNRAGKVTGAEVCVSPTSTCSVYGKLRESQRLIGIGKTASSLAHGVRNPLNAIKGAVVYLREKYADEPTLMEFTSIMENEISRLDNFISRFLSNSASDTAPSRVDVNSVLRKIEAFTSLQMQAANVESVFDYGDVFHVLMDSFQFEHAVLNIINNSLEAMPDGGRLTVRSLSELRSGTNYAIVMISDTGKGMSGSAEDAFSIFRKERGRGFGLFITREILQYYGGYLEVKTEKGSGTTVRLCIPANHSVEGNI